MKYVRIHYGWIRSGEWPHMAMVRALQQQAIYADPVVDDWPRIKARTLVIGGEKDGADYPGQAKRVAETVQNGQLYVIPNVGHNPQFEAPELLYPPLLRFLKGEDVGVRKTSTGRPTELAGTSRRSLRPVAAIRRRFERVSDSPGRPAIGPITRCEGLQTRGFEQAASEVCVDARMSPRPNRSQ